MIPCIPQDQGGFFCPPALPGLSLPWLGRTYLPNCFFLSPFQPTCFINKALKCFCLNDTAPLKLLLPHLPSWHLALHVTPMLRASLALSAYWLAWHPLLSPVESN